MIEHALAVVTGRDIDSAREWYERLFDRRPDNTPMASLVEWRVASAAWLQVTVDPERAGSSMFNVAVDELAPFVDAARAPGHRLRRHRPRQQGSQTLDGPDPDGNSITAIGGFRKDY